MFTEVTSIYSVIIYEEFRRKNRQTPFPPKLNHDYHMIVESVAITIIQTVFLQKQTHPSYNTLQFHVCFQKPTSDMRRCSQKPTNPFSQSVRQDT